MPPKQSNYKTPAPVQGPIQQTQKKKVAPVKTGRVNYTTLEDVPEGTCNTPFLNSRPILISLLASPESRDEIPVRG